MLWARPGAHYPARLLPSSHDKYLSSVAFTVLRCGLVTILEMMVLNLKRTTTTSRPLFRAQPRPRVALAFATILSLCLITVVFNSQLFFNNFIIHRYLGNDQSDKFIMDDSSTEVERAGEVENMIEGAETPTRTLPNGSTSEGSTYHSIIDSKSPSPTQVKIYLFGTKGKKAQSMFHTVSSFIDTCSWRVFILLHLPHNICVLYFSGSP